MDVLYREKEVGKEEGVKVLNFWESARGKPYNFKKREVICTLGSHNVGTNQIEPVFNAILSLVIIKILDIPCKRTNSKVIIN